MKHSININVLNNATGIPTTKDGIMMLCCKAVAVANTFNLDQAYLVTKLADLATLGITPAYDAANGVAVYQQASEFYLESGDGALLWLVGVAKATTFQTYAQGTVLPALIRGTAVADPTQRAKMIGLCNAVPTGLQSATDFPADVTASLIAMQALQATMFAQGYQFSFIIDGYNMSSAVASSALGTMATQACASGSMCITGTKPNGVSAVGLALGRFARISLGHGVGAVADGPRNTTSAFLTNGIMIPTTGVLTVGVTYTVFGGSVLYNGVTYQNGQSFVCVVGFTSYSTADTGQVYTGATPVQNIAPTDIDSLGTKMFFFLRTWFNHSGFYWNDGATCTDPTLQLSTQEYNRVANALSAAALSFFINEIGKNLALDTKTGSIAQAYLNTKQQEFYNQYIAPLNSATGTSDLSDGSLILSGPNFNATKTMNFTLKIVPTPILGSVAGTIQFSSTL